MNDSILTAAIQHKYPGCRAIYVPSWGPYLSDLQATPNDTPATIAIVDRAGAVIYDRSTDFAEQVEQYRQYLSRLLGRPLSKNHILTTGKWEIE